MDKKIILLLCVVASIAGGFYYYQYKVPYQLRQDHDKIRGKLNIDNIVSIVHTVRYGNQVYTITLSNGETIHWFANSTTVISRSGDRVRVSPLDVLD